MRAKLAGLRKVFFIALLVGIVINVVVLLYYQPWGPKLGVPGSPERLMLQVIVQIYLFYVPLMLWIASIVAGKPEWIAPRGRYVEGQDPKLFTPYTYTAIAFTAALFTAAGIGVYQVADLPAGAAALGIMYFHPIIGWFTLWLGGTLRAMVFGQGNPVQWAISSGIMDGGVWIVLGLAYWWAREQTEWGKKPLLLTIWWIVVYWVWRTIAQISILLFHLPFNMYLPQLINFWVAQMTSGTVVTVAMLWVVEAIIRAREGRSAADKDGPAA